MVFGLNGNARYQIENDSPYALSGNTGANYHPWNYSMGSHTLTATPYPQRNGSGTAGTGLTVSFTIVSGGSSPQPTATQSQGAGSGPRIASFTLIDANTDRDLATINNGDVFNLAQLGTTKVNIRVNTSPAQVGSVIIGVNNNSRYKVENTAPYTVGSSSGSDYYAWNYPSGTIKLTATPYQWSSGGGTAGTPLTVNFSIVSGTANHSADETLVSRRGLFKRLLNVDDTV